jgi:hypothetical protein
MEGSAKGWSQSRGRRRRHTGGEEEKDRREDGEMRDRG